MTRWTPQIYHVIIFKDVNVIMLTLEMLFVRSDD